MWRRRGLRRRVSQPWGALLVAFRPVLAIPGLGRRTGTPTREHVLIDAYRRHAAKTIFTARHLMGLRAAAFLSAGIARVPFWKFILVDTGAALLGVPTGFALAYFFTDQVHEIVHDVRRVERWLTLLALVALAAWIAVHSWRKRID